MKNKHRKETKRVVEKHLLFTHRGKKHKKAIIIAQ